jgi:hypothetical protein
MIVSGENATSVTLRAVSFTSYYIAYRTVDWTYDLIAWIIHTVRLVEYPLKLLPI